MRAIMKNLTIIAVFVCGLSSTYVFAGDDKSKETGAVPIELLDQDLPIVKQLNEGIKAAGEENVRINACTIAAAEACSCCCAKWESKSYSCCIKKDDFDRCIKEGTCTEKTCVEWKKCD